MAAQRSRFLHKHALTGATRLSGFAAAITAAITAASIAASATALPPPQERTQLADAPLGNATELPSNRDAEALLAAGDVAWADSLSASDGAQAGLVRRAFDAWQTALATTEAGAGARCALADAPGSPFETAAGLADRRAEGACEGVLRRLAQIGDARKAWTERFTGSAESDWNEARLADYDSSTRQMARIERIYPCTVPAVLAAIACADLALEEGRTSAAAAWAGRAMRHLRLMSEPSARTPELSRYVEAARRRQAEAQGLSDRAYLGRDHTTPQPIGAGPRTESSAAAPKISLSERHRIAGITRSADDPFGRGLPSGLAILNSGTALAQSALGLIMIQSEGKEGGSLVTRMKSDEALGTARAIIQATRSTGGWASLPGTDGVHVALVVGRGERTRASFDLAVPPRGNVIGVVTEGPKDRAILAKWSLRDGVVIRMPAPATGKEIGPGRLAPMGKGSPVKGWEFGLGWEFQPGPVVADGQVFALARCFGDPTFKEADFADEVRLFALDLGTAEVLWSREVTSERGVGDQGRGNAGRFAVTTMPLGFARDSGTILVGTNGGLLAAYGAAEGRLLWAMRHHRTKTSDGGWPGSEAPLLVSSPKGLRAPGVAQIAWFTPLGCDFAYAMPAGPLPLPREPSAPERVTSWAPLEARPRPRRAALSLAAALPEPQVPGTWSLLLLGRDGRFDAAIIDPPTAPRLPASYLAPAERLSGPAAFDGNRLYLPGTQDLSVLDRGAGFAIRAAAPIPSAGAGRGGKAVAYRRKVYVLGRDTVWIYSVN